MYTIIEFGSTYLPLARPTQDVGTGQASNYKIFPLPGGGAFHSSGTDRSLTQGPTINVTGAISILGQTTSQLETQERGLRALVGKVDKLYRQWSPSTLIEWTYAKCKSVGPTRTADNKTYLDIPFIFEQISPCWYGPANTPNEHLFTSADSTIQYTITNSGNCQVTNPIVKLDPAIGSVTRFDLWNFGNDATRSIYFNHFHFTGTPITTSDELEIDCSALTVMINNYFVEYSHFYIDTDHKSDQWLNIIPGINYFQATIAGGGNGTFIHTSFYDGEM